MLGLEEVLEAAAGFAVALMVCCVRCAPLTSFPRRPVFLAGGNEDDDDDNDGCCCCDCVCGFAIASGCKEQLGTLAKSMVTRHSILVISDEEEEDCCLPCTYETTNRVLDDTDDDDDDKGILP